MPSFSTAIQVISDLAIPVVLFAIIGYGVIKKVKLYEAFVEGAKGGFEVAIKIIPFLVAILVAIGMFRASGAMDVFTKIIAPVTNLIGMPAEALPVALMRPLSGSGTLGLVTEIMKTHGPDSFIGRLVSTMYGSTETTFYVLAVYFGSVGIKKTRHAVLAGLLADAAGLLAALLICKIVFS
ncbi:MAG: spore maturation protein [Calditrichaeota bacterium]|nr:MAG: spore maturation protein [Calditrichota bacterium]